jgi:hypothetical protein
LFTPFRNRRKGTKPFLFCALDRYAFGCTKSYSYINVQNYEDSESGKGKKRGGKSSTPFRKETALALALAGREYHTVKRL